MNNPPLLPVDFLSEKPPFEEDELRLQVWGLLSALYPRLDLPERRKETRYPFPYLVHLTPVGADGITPEGETIVVVGKHLSEQGLGFYHPKPLPHRRMIASLESQGRWLGFLIDLNWCRFTRQGWYESGGRFLQAVLSPIPPSSSTEGPPNP
ncbi:MAG: hypothetical protein JXB10_09145 [Pirellulales bacterium]|nr:hypothetical protein [Pirellulales bacterium]